MCWYEPSEESKKLIKDLCQQIVDEIKSLEKIGDPIGISIKETKELLDHLYDPYSCTEKKEWEHRSMTNSQYEQFMKDTQTD